MSGTANGDETETEGRDASSVGADDSRRRPALWVAVLLAAAVAALAIKRRRS